MRADRYLKKTRMLKSRSAGQAIAINSPARVKKLMASISKIDWSNPYKDFIK
jgi:ribosomal 50S subunit-recycling heat shock protein